MKNPYKELTPYIEGDACSFKGRSVEIEEMYERFERNEYLVCHADSGEGKSSIIEAGLIPKMRSNCFLPIRILFKSDEHFKNNDVDFDRVICGIISNEVEKLRANKDITVSVIYPNRLTDSDDPEPADWGRQLIDSNAWLQLRYARITIDNLVYTPVLIFDQFEEVFTNPLSQEWTDRFFAWLQELSADLCPQRIVKAIEAHVSDEDFPEIATRKCFKAIFSLRSEYIGKLDYWGVQRHYIPQLKNSRYLLRPLTIQGAREVITCQEGYNGLNAVADKIIDILRRQQKGRNYVQSLSSTLPCIPALFLSVVCSRAFSMTEQQRTNFMQQLAAENDEDKNSAVNTLTENFYMQAIADTAIPPDDMDVIEDVLVNNEGSRQRVSSQADALKAIDFTGKYMECLKKARLIRVIPEYNKDDDSVEFVHDALCPAILKRKELRQAEKAKERERQLLLEQKRKAKKRRTVLTLACLISLFSIGAVIYVWNINHKMRINESRVLAEKASQLVDEGDSYLARLVALEAWDKENTGEAESALRIAVEHNNAILRGHKAHVCFASFSPDGKRIVSASGDNTVRIWDAQTGRQIGLPLVGHKAHVCFASFSPDGMRTVSASSDGTIRIWDAQTGCQIGQPLEGHTNSVHSASFSPDGKRIVSASGDKTVRIWDAQTGRQIGQPLEGHIDGVSSASFSPDGKRIASASEDGTIRIWDAQTGRQIGQPLEGHTNAVESASFSPDGKRIVSASRDNTVRIWDTQTGRQIGQPLEGHTNSVHSASFSPDGKRIVSASGDNTVRIWDVQTGRQIGQPLEGHKAHVCSASFSPDGKRIVSASDDETVRIWDTQTGRLIGRPLKKHTLAVRSASFSPDGKRIVSASDDGTIRIWDAQTGRQIGQPLEGHTMSFASFSPDGKRIVSASWDYTVRIWDEQTGRQIGQPLEGHTSLVYSASFSPDGKRIVSASSDGTIRIWDAQTGRQIGQPLEGHTNGVSSATFSPDGKRIVSASGDYTVRIWEFPPIEQLVSDTRKRFKDRPLTQEERRKYYLE